jgi:hypothetical protein
VRRVAQNSNVAASSVVDLHLPRTMIHLESADGHERGHCFVPKHDQAILLKLAHA